jgi:hypothetical protein
MRPTSKIIHYWEKEEGVSVSMKLEGSRDAIFVTDIAEAFTLPRRILRVLRDHGVNTVNQLITCSANELQVWRDWRDWRGMTKSLLGKASVKTIRTALLGMNLYLKGEHA